MSARAYWAGLVIGILSPIAAAGTARAQWSGSNPVTTLSQVGIGTTTPHESSELSGSGLVRLRINANSPSANGGIRLSSNGSIKWSVAAYDTGNDIDPNHFSIYNDGLGQTVMDVSAGNNIYLAGATNFGGQLSINGNLIPGLDNTYSLGMSGLRWSQVWAANGFIQTSDARLKKDVVKLRYGIDEVLKLRPVTFRWKSGADTSNTHVGLIAQEVEKVIPEVIVHADKSDDPLGMDYAGLVPVLVRAIQDEQAEMRQQDARIERLESGRAAPEATLPWTGEIIGLAMLPAAGLTMYRLRRRQSKRA